MLCEILSEQLYQNFGLSMIFLHLATYAGNSVLVFVDIVNVATKSGYNSSSAYQDKKLRLYNRICSDWSSILYGDCV